MILNIYAIRDIHTGYLSPTFEVSDAVAIRNFEHAVCQGDSLLFSHPADYSLWRLGKFDTDTALFADNTPEHVVDASSCLQPLKGV